MEDARGGVERGGRREVAVVDVQLRDVLAAHDPWSVFICKDSRLLPSNPGSTSSTFSSICASSMVTTSFAVTTRTVSPEQNLSLYTAMRSD